MAELEHSGSVHSVFGFDIKKLHEVKTATTFSEAEVDIYYEGPQRKLPTYLSVATGLKENDRFVQYAKLRFGPVHAIYDLEWWIAGTEKRRPLQLKFVIFFNPVTDTTCEQYTFFFVKTSSASLTAILNIFRSVLVRMVDRELRGDHRLVETLCLSPGQYSEYLLGRFDHPIRKSSDMINSLYFQHTAPPENGPMTPSTRATP
jgi:hypothetical protein